MDVIRSFDDPTRWGDIKENVPIFRAHKWWERRTANGVEEKTTLPGEPDLRGEEGWILKYEVTDADLPIIRDRINHLLEHDAKPIKLMVGHRRVGAPQEMQPEIAGLGRGATLGTFGAHGIPAVMTKAYYKKGYENAASDYPERSSEYRHAMKDITAVALLKTEPRLPMGMTGYMSVDDVSLYGVGFMADEVTKPEEKKDDAAPPFAKKEGEGDAAKPEDKVTDKPAEPAIDAKPPVAPEPPTISPNALAPLGPEEQNMAMRFYNFYQTNLPEMKYMCGEFAKYQAASSAMAGASPTNGTSPANPIGKEIPDEEESHMAATAEITQYAERLAAQEKQMATVLAENASLYADQQIEILQRKKSKKIPNRDKLHAKFVKAKLSGDPEACKELFDDVVQNYATAEQAPVSRGFTPVVDPKGVANDLPEGAPEAVHLSPEDVAEITNYADTEKIDMLADGGFDKAFQGFIKKKKAQTAA